MFHHDERMGRVPMDLVHLHEVGAARLQQRRLLAGTAADGEELDRHVALELAVVDEQTAPCSAAAGAGEADIPAGNLGSGGPDDGPSRVLAVPHVPSPIVVVV
ncbi:MAG: hypothetical protein U0575_02670 [Phycisphaerales bacterium]